jgi:hypothetical protein
MTLDRAPEFSATPRLPSAEATEHLARLLTRLADALVAVDAAALLEIEPELGGAIAALGVCTGIGGRAEVAAAAGRAGAALLRCRRLGASFSGMARALGRVGQAEDGYDRAGTYIERPRVYSSLQLRA